MIVAVQVVRQHDSATGSFRLVNVAGRQYVIHIRPVADQTRVLFGHIPSISPVMPILGSVERAERAALRAIERLCAEPQVTTEEDAHAAKG